MKIKTMEDVKIFVPSRSRADRVLTKEVVSNIILVVNADQEEAYKEHNPELEVLALPNSISGITATRQWILDNYPDCFMLDDDIYQVRKNYAEKGEDSFVKDPEEVYEIIQATYRIAKQLNAKLWGFTNMRNPLQYKAHEPYSLNGYFCGSHSGFVEGHGLSYNVSMNEAEDHYISLMNAYKNRYGFMNNMFSFVTKDNWVATGGCSDYRKQSSLVENTIKLRKLFGEAVTIKISTKLKSKVNYGERSLSIPY